MMPLTDVERRVCDRMAQRMGGTFVIHGEAKAMTDRPEYLIRKGAYWYRPNCQGYTTDPAQAGRYTLPAALAYTHPNGLDGPRDGLTFMHESDVPCATAAQPDAAALVEAVRGAAKNAEVQRVGVLLHATDWLAVMDALAAIGKAD